MSYAPLRHRQMDIRQKCFMVCMMYDSMTLTWQLRLTNKALKWLATDAFSFLVLPAGIDFYAVVLSGNLWGNVPALRVEVEVPLPPVVIDCRSAFSAFFRNENPYKKLTWLTVCMIVAVFRTSLISCFDFPCFFVVCACLFACVLVSMYDREKELWKWMAAVSWLCQSAKWAYWWCSTVTRNCHSCNWSK